MSECELLERLMWFEHVRSEFASVLASDHVLWDKLPCLFLSLPQTSWQALADEVESLLASKEESSDPDMQAPELLVARTKKRFEVYTALVRDFAKTLLRNPNANVDLPNPCDASIHKRAWERACYSQRQKLKPPPLQDAKLSALLPKFLIDARVLSTSIETDQADMTKVPIIDHFCVLHVHPRDEALTFDAAIHTYFIHGV